MNTQANQIRREARAKQTAEVFTPASLVRQMLKKLPNEVWHKNKSFLDPACGNGNFLVAVLVRKIERGHNPLDALRNVYGVDIMKDNIQECRLRLLKIISVYTDVTEEHIRTVFQNIVWINQERYPNGSLDYDFAFDGKNIKQANIDRWMRWVDNNKLDEVELPVEETDIFPAGGWIEFT